ncbi:SOS response-associated peptidase [Streptomyces goshikiensis]|uniref:SOS response-associated peptidase n=1 Tax=Streptomyces goshikiensis TaxID=1942 RepID=UPI003685EB8F
MCGRYAAGRGPEDLVELFGIEKWEPGETLAPDWNVAPTKEVHVVLDRPVKDAADRRPVRQLRVLKWGLVPSWAKSPEGAARMINARSETLAEKPSFKRPFAQRRCIIPADGYYEWVTAHDERELEVEGKRKRARKQPYFVLPADGSVLAMAGIYEFWRDRTLPDEHPMAWWVTCSVITTEAETGPLAAAPAEGPGSLSEIHPRMPLMLTPDTWDPWLDPARTDPDELRHLLAPPPGGLMRAYPVSTAVSNVRNNGAELLTELAAPEEATLF